MAIKGQVEASGAKLLLGSVAGASPGMLYTLTEQDFVTAVNIYKPKIVYHVDLMDSVISGVTTDRELYWFQNDGAHIQTTALRE